MIVDLMSESSDRPRYFIGQSGVLFYSDWDARFDAYYLRRDSATDWEWVNANGETRDSMNPSEYGDPFSIWKEVTEERIEELAAEHKEGADLNYQKLPKSCVVGRMSWNKRLEQQLPPKFKG